MYTQTCTLFDLVYNIASAFLDIMELCAEDIVRLDSMLRTSHEIPTPTDARLCARHPPTHAPPAPRARAFPCRLGAEPRPVDRAPPQPVAQALRVPA
eukprot:1886109-Pleurochrysis_carterae.AAC.1